MTDRGRLEHYGPALSAGLALLLAFVSLGGYQAADLPGGGVAPTNPRPLNPCGFLGATLAQFLLSWLGSASWILLAGCCILLLRGMTRRVTTRALLESLGGFILLLLVATVGFQKASVPLGPTTIVGPGGYVGSLVQDALEWHFGLLGTKLLLTAIAVVSIALLGDFFKWIPLPLAITSWLARLRIPRRFPALQVGGSAGGHGMSGTNLSRSFSEIVDDTSSRRPGTAALGPGRRTDLGNASAVGSTRPPVVSSANSGRSSRAIQRLDHNPPVPVDGSYEAPPLELLDPSPEFAIHEHEAKIHERAGLLERTLLDFGYQVRVVQIDTGPVITQFEIELEAGLRVSRIIGLADDLAIALAVPSVRVVAPIPGKTTVGVEVPNDARAIVRLSEVYSGSEPKLERFKIPLFLGKDVKGTPLVFDLADMPHLLIAGRTGTGKSVCLNAMILSILMTKSPDEVKLLLIDPKMVELSQFKRIPHLMHPVVTDMKKAESILSWACDKMDERYGYLARAGVRNIQSYNELGAEEIYARVRPEDDDERAAIPTYMPYIVILADEMADLMMTAAKEVESHIVRLAQKSRAVGMHLIVATQKPTVDVITGLIKGNLPARIAFQVASRGDSRVVLDEMGADRLLGNGDMLFLIPGTSHIVRAQGTYVSDGEVNRVCSYLQQYPVEFSKEIVQLQVSGGPGGKERGEALRQRDEYYEAAIEIVVREGRGSCSLLQRALGIGYGRAARLIDFMAEDGIVGEYKSGSAREVLYSWEEWESIKSAGSQEAVG